MRYLVLVIFLVGCSGIQMTKDTPYTEQEFQADSTSCEVAMSQAGYTGGILGRAFYKRCMIGKGWREAD